MALTIAFIASIMLNICQQVFVRNSLENPILYWKKVRFTEVYNIFLILAKKH